MLLPSALKAFFCSQKTKATPPDYYKFQFIIYPGTIKRAIRAPNPPTISKMVGQMVKIARASQLYRRCPYKQPNRLISTSAYSVFKRYKTSGREPSEPCDTCNHKKGKMTDPASNQLQNYVQTNKKVRPFAFLTAS